MNQKKQKQKTKEDMKWNRTEQEMKMNENKIDSLNWKQKPKNRFSFSFYSIYSD